MSAVTERDAHSYRAHVEFIDGYHLICFENVFNRYQRRASSNFVHNVKNILVLRFNFDADSLALFAQF